MEPSFDFPGHSNGPQNPFLRPNNNNPFEKLTRGGDFSDLQSLWRTKRDASEGLVEVDEDDFYEFLQQVNDNWPAQPRTPNGERRSRLPTRIATRCQRAGLQV